MATDTVSDVPVSSGRLTLAVGRFGGRVAREATLVVLAGLGLSVAFNWPVVRHPRTTVMSGIGDPLLQAWQLAWTRHFFAGGDFWTANTFYPAKDSFAFSDSLLGYQPFSFLFGDGQYAAVLRYNVVFVLAFALAFVGGYLLTRQLGGTWQAAAVAGLVYAWAPWRLAHNAHLNILSTGGIALAFFALARGHGYSFRFGVRPEWARPRWAVVGWLVAAWQVTIGFAVGLPFAYVMVLLGLVIVVVNVVRRREFGRRLVAANGVGLVVFLVVTYLMTIPYLRVEDRYHFTRTLAELRSFSPSLRSFWTGTDQSWLWHGGVFDNIAAIPGPFPGEELLFPGLVVALFALLGLVVSAWPVRVRIGLGVGAAVAIVLTLGTTFFGGNFSYLLLWRYAPGWNALRTPGRLILWVTLLLILLAAGAITRLAQLLAERGRSTTPAWGKRKRGLVALVLVLPVIGALLEAVPDQTYGTTTGIPPDLRTIFTQTNEPLLILPITPLSEFNYMLWSTDGFPQIANGDSTNLSPQYQEIVANTQTFPDSRSIAELEKFGIRKVVVLRVAAASTPYAAALTRPLAGLPATKTETADVVVFTLS